ncbi:hypothetical protein [Duncaniella dubosii]|uniref:hypothetical protein n=1 Tax=Duncaniella dubosii TaxID=2518971 RepID=UPI0023F56F76|nr:hypothetical protein [Duncaniella dubosii]MCX4285285.1 hypothetical protein [Duncaniella dubosii]
MPGLKHISVAAVWMIVLALPSWGRTVRDTVLTSMNDRIILSYTISNTQEGVSVDFAEVPRIIPKQKLSEACKGDCERLKIVIFDRIGDYGKVEFKGAAPSAFMVPAGLTYEKSKDGFLIFGEGRPLEFHGPVSPETCIRLPLYVVYYEKKQRYRILAASAEPLIVRPWRQTGAAVSASRVPRQETIEIVSTEEDESNEDITNALSSMDLVHQLLERVTELPFPQALQMEIFNLRALKNKIKDRDVIERINAVLLEYSDRESELKEIQDNAMALEKARVDARLEHEKQEAAAERKQAEENMRQQEEKQQKRNIFMIIGAAIVALVAFIGNAVFRHFREIANQRSMMEMQEDLIRQAEHDATRRAREVVHNKAHKAINDGRTQMRRASQSRQPSSASNRKQNNKPRSI